MKDNAKPLNVQQRSQLYEYYLSLKRFVDITGCSTDRSMTSRAQKARSKLLKLSESQFFELSTDVNDELERRINETHNRSAFLTPNTKFHTKRNQARQKLANLADARFNDLVDDILYEISRRRLDTLPEVIVESKTETSVATPERPGNVHSETVNTLTGSHLLPERKDQGLGNESDLSTSRYNENSASNTMLLLSEVIPKTASIAWTSEEEEEEEQEEDGVGDGEGEEREEQTVENEESDQEKEEEENASVEEEIREDQTVHRTSLELLSEEGITQNKPQEDEDAPFDSVVINTLSDEEMPSSAFMTSKEKVEPFSSLNISATPADIEQPVADGSLSSISRHVSLNEEPLSHSSSHQMLHQNKENSLTATSSSPKTPQESMLQFPESVKHINQRMELLIANEKSTEKSKESLEEENSLLQMQLSQLRLENRELKDKLENSSTTKALDSNFHRSISELSSQLNKLSIENEVLKQENLELELKMKNIGSPMKSNNAALENDVQIWKSKYEAILSTTSLSDITLAPIKNAALFPSYCTIPSSLIDELDSMLHSILSSLSRESISDEDLFKSIAVISDYCIKISSFANSQEAKTKKILLENVQSHTITSVRYYATYRTPLLKFVLQNALSEIANVIYDLVKVVNVGTEGPLQISSSFKKDIESTSELSSPTTPFDENRVASSASEFILEKPMAPPISSMEVEMSPVKPLKITQKKASDDLVNKPTSGRKPSGPGLFTAMLNGSAKKNSGSSSKSKNNANLSFPLEKPSIESKKVLPSPTNISQSVENETEDTFSNANMNDKLLEIGLKDSQLSTPLTPNGKVNNFEKIRNPSLESSTEVMKGEKNSILSSPTIPISSSPTIPISSSPIIPIPSSPNKSKLFEDLNSDIYSDEQLSVKEDGSIADTDNESTYEALRNVMKVKAKNEHETDEQEMKDESSFKPVLNHAPIDPSIDDLDLNEKPFDFENSNEEKNMVFHTSNNSTVSSISQQSFMNDEGENQEETISDDANLSPKNPETSARTIPTTDQISSAVIKDEAMGSSEHPSEASSIEGTHLKDDEDIVQLQRFPTKNSSKDVDSSFGSQTEVAKEEVSYSVEEPEFDIDAFDIENPDNSLSDLLLYLEYQTMDVINTIQSLLSSIKEPKSTTGELRLESNAINQVIRQMVEATSISMNQSRNAFLKEHGSWVVQSLDDCHRRMTTLCYLESDGTVKKHAGDEEFGDKHFKQRLAGITFDIAKCTKELVKTVEQASLQSNIDYLNAQLSQ